jgi:hypothetical protein
MKKKMNKREGRAIPVATRHCWCASSTPFLSQTSPQKHQADWWPT